MYALVIEDGVRLEKDYPPPLLKPGEALIRTSLAGICATDLEILQGYAGFQGIPGHEFVGIVERADDIALVGQRVVGEINGPCRSCPTCQRGDGNHCPHRFALGIRYKDGVFAENFTLPQVNLHRVPKGLSDRQAVFTEPLAAALEILQQRSIGPNDTVAVLGDGRLALLIAQVLALTGCDLTVIGRHPAKWAVLENRSIRVYTEDQLPRGYSAKIVVEATGRKEGFAHARELVRPRGTLVIKSTFKEPVLVDLSALVVDEITLIGSRCGPFQAALRLLASGLIEVEPLIEAEFALENGVEAFAMAREKGRMKVLLRP